MRKEYRIAKGWEVFIWVCLPLFMIFFGVIGIIPYTEEEFHLTKALILTFVSVGFECLLVLGLIDSKKNKIIIESDRIVYVGLFKTKNIEFKDIKGFRENDKYLFFIPVDEGAADIKVSIYFGHYNEIRIWAEQQFNNLDSIDLEQEEKDIIEDNNLGICQEERENKLKRAKKLTLILNITSWVVAILTLLYPHFYQVQVLLCALLPIAGIVVYKTSNGLIRLDEKPNSVRPNIISTLLIPSCTLFIRGILDFYIFDYSNLWKLGLIIIVVLGIFILKNSKVGYNFKKGSIFLYALGVLFVGGMYAFGLLTTTNAAFDTSQPTIYKAKVTGMYVTSGKSTSYNLKLGEWGPQKKPVSISVPKDIYLNKIVGDSVTIYFNKGLFKIPYYFVIQ